MSIKKMAGNRERRGRRVEHLEDTASLSINSLESLSVSHGCKGGRQTLALVTGIWRGIIFHDSLPSHHDQK